MEVVSADRRNGEREELAAGRRGDAGCFEVLSRLTGLSLNRKLLTG